MTRPVLLSSLWNRVSGINRRLLLIVVCLAVPFVIYIVVNTMRQQQTERERAGADVLEVARLIAARLDDRVETIKTLLGVLAPALSLDPAQRDRNDLVLTKARAQLPAFINNVALWDLQGNNLATLDKSVRDAAFRVIDRDYFRDAIARGKLAIEAPIMSRSNGEYIAQFALPVKSDSGAVLAVLTCSMRLKELQGFVELVDLRSSESLVSVIDPRGVILARSIDPALWIGKNVSQSGTFSENQGVVEAVRERRGLDGVLRISGFTQAREVPWRVFVGVPSSVVLSSARYGAVQALLLGVMMLLVSLIGIIFVARSITRPIIRLAADAERFGHGELAHRSEAAGVPELKALATAMNAMAASLQRREIQLLKSERHLRAVTDHLPAIIAYVDRSEKYTFINARGVEYFKRDAVDILGRTIQECLGDTIYTAHRQNIHDALSGRVVTFQRHQDDSAGGMVFQTDYVPDLNKNGEVVGFFAMTSDISHLKATEAQLAREKERLVLITDNMPALIAYIDADQRFQFANKTYESWFGLKASGFLGLTFSDVYGSEMGKTFAPLLNEALLGHRVNHDLEVATKAGRKHLHVTAIPDFDSAGRVVGLYALGIDITRARIAELLRTASEHRLRTITDSLPALVCYIDQARVFTFNNATYAKWLRRPMNEITSRPVQEVYGDEVYAQLGPHIDRALAGNKAEFDVDFVARDGTTHTARGTYLPEVNDQGTVLGIYGLVSDVTLLKRAEDKLRKLAQFDVLTGLPNRNQFNERFDDLFNDRSAALSVLFIDVDFFKSINDRYGHAGGDSILKQFGQRLADTVRPTDFVARLAGDEFVVLLRTRTGGADARFVGNKILKSLQAPFKVFGTDVVVTLSIGAATRLLSDTTAADLLKRADKALYFAKEAGRNGLHLDEDVMPEQSASGTSASH